MEQTSTEVVSPVERIVGEAIKNQPNVDLEKLAKLLEIQERYEAVQAKKAYHKAMTEFKANPPVIDKDRKVAYGNTKYSHATLGNVTQKISSELSKYGLSASWRTTTTSTGAISVTCMITHVLGHSEQTELPAPPDTSGSKNSIQAIGSTVTYLERYTILALTGLATFDQDDDAQSASTKITTEQVDKLRELLMARGLTESIIFKYMKVEKIQDIQASDFNKALNGIASVRKPGEK